ncbi:MAG TPA: DUF6067 family protein [Planctomycetota bacterium]|nr:DUF6067 family protein [Planctomycetota bacterium]
MRLVLSCTAVLILMAVAAPAGEPKFQYQAGAQAGTGAWVVSPRSYWRYHYTFRPAQSWDAKAGKLTFLPTRYGALNTGPTGNQLATPEPPAEWTKAEFDDSAWPVNRAPLPWMPDMDQDGQAAYCCHVIRRACGRTRFLVPDPARVSKLTLEIKFHGGMIAYVNGQEVGRANVARDGALAAEGFAEAYPPENYRHDKGWWPPTWPYHRWRDDLKPDQLAQIDKLESIRVRTLKVEVPKSALRAGANVLSVENRLSPVLAFEMGGRMEVSQWSGRIPHIGITDVALSSDPAGAVVSADARPAGAQAWARDIHQWTLQEDFLEPGAPQSRVLRMAAPRNGACSAQAALGSAGELSAPSATVTELAGPGGAKIPAAVVSVRWARPLAIKQVKQMHKVAFFTYMPDRWLIRYRGAPADTWVAEWCPHWDEGRVLAELWAKDTMQVFDQLSPAAPAKIPAGASQPVWVTVEVPKDAAPGLYTGALSVKAGGMDEAKFEVRLQVFDYQLAAPKDYTAYAGIDESPWALAKWAGVKLWSEEHWKLLEQSIAAAGRLGARVAGIPVIHDTELNNGKDAMIKWVKKADGGYDFDFTLADRYLELWRKHCHSQSDVIVYLVHTANEYGKGGGTGAVTLVDGGKESAFTPPKADTPEGAKLWLACGKAIREHFSAKGIKDENLHWGLFYDYIGASSYALAEPLAKELPGVGWARSSHEGRKIHGSAEMGGGNAVKVTWNAAVRAEQKPPFSKDGKVTPLKGWSNPTARLLLPRADSDVSALSILPPLWQMREVQEMPITSLHRGFGRICMDGWGRGAYFGPFNPWLVYPAEGGRINASIQYEVLREGLQETEARISLEKKEPLSAEARKVLDLRTERVWMIPPRPEGQRISEYYAGWQESSWDLYAAAAAAAGGKAPGVDERAKFFGAASK